MSEHRWEWGGLQVYDNMIKNDWLEMPTLPTNTLRYKNLSFRERFYEEDGTFPARITSFNSIYCDVFYSLVLHVTTADAKIEMTMYDLAWPCGKVACKSGSHTD